MVAKETVDAIEKTLEVVEDQVETLERIPKVHLNGTTKAQQIVILSATALAGAAVGVGVSYKVIQRHWRLHYEELAEKDLAEAKEHYSKLYKKDDYSDPVKLADAVDDLEEYTNKVEDLEYAAPQGPKPTEQHLLPEEVQEVLDEAVTMDSALGEEAQVVVNNIFVNARKSSKSDEWDYDEELAKREQNPGEPYIVHEDEFMQNDPEHEQISLTYFEGDDILVDERDSPLPDSDATVGDKNLMLFGHGSNDKNIIYIRNETLKMDFEIALSKGDYAQEVHGFIKHSHEPGRIRKFRSEDE